MDGVDGVDALSDPASRGMSRSRKATTCPQNVHLTLLFNYACTTLTTDRRSFAFLFLTFNSSTLRTATAQSFSGNLGVPLRASLLTNGYGWWRGAGHEWNLWPSRSPQCVAAVPRYPFAPFLWPLTVQHSCIPTVSLQTPHKTLSLVSSNRWSPGLRH